MTTTELSPVIAVGGRGGLGGLGAGLPDELLDVLRDGPFPLALDLAIRYRRLSLDSVQRRMAQRGAYVSQASLSYWRRGQRRPAGDRSLRAVHVLEDCLGLPQNALARLIGPPRRRGRRSADLPGPVGLETVFDIDPERFTAFDGIDIESNNQLSVMSLQALARIGADRTEESVTTQMVVSSNHDGVDRWVCFFDPVDGTGHLPTITGFEGCRPGRMRTDPDRDLLAAELRFDYPLRAGDTYVFSFQITYAGRRPRSDVLQYGLRTPVRNLVMQVRFHPAAVPVRCYRYRRSRGGRAAAGAGELAIGASLTSHVVLLDVPPSVNGIRWEWD